MNLQERVWRAQQATPAPTRGDVRLACRGEEGIVVPYRTFATPEEAQEFARSTVAFWRAGKVAPLPAPHGDGEVRPILQPPTSARASAARAVER